MKINNNTLTKISMYLIIMFIGFGPIPLLLIKPSLLQAEYDGSTYFTQISIALFFLCTLFEKSFFKSIIKNRFELILLSTIPIFFYISAIIYNINEAYFNFKLLGAIILYISLSYQFQNNPKTKENTIRLFVIISGISAILYALLLNSPFAVYSNGRYFFLGENPNGYSFRFVFALFFCWRILCKTKSITYKILLLFFCLLWMVMIYLSGSRGAVLFLFIGVILQTLLTKQRIVKTSKVILIILLGLYFTTTFKTPNKINNVNTIERIQESIYNQNTAGRSEIWAEALNIFYEHPIIGIGENGYKDEMFNRYQEKRDTHNVYIYILVCGGIISFIPWISFFLNLAFRAWKQRWHNPFIFTSIFIIILFVGKTGGVITYSFLWYLLSLTKSETIKI